MAKNNRKFRGLRWRRAISAYWMILPSFILYSAFVIYPMFKSFWISLHKWDGFSDMTWVGVDNYLWTFRDNIFWLSLGHTFLFALGVTVVKNITGLLLAMLLNRNIFGKTFFRTSIFLPTTISFVVIGVLWSWIYNPIFGILNSLLRLIGLENLISSWLSDPNIALWSIMVADIWKWTGFHMVIFLAGLQTIPQILYEAAILDGANSWQKFRFITIPLLSQITAVSVTLSIIGAIVSNYDIVHVMTGGGPYHATEVALTWIISTALRYGNLGKANAMSVVLFFCTLIIGLFQFMLMTRNKEDVS